jgi:hypothetical protein
MQTATPGFFAKSPVAVNRVAMYLAARDEARKRYEAELRRIDRTLLLRTAQVARMFRVTRQTVYRWCDAGLIRYFDGGAMGRLFDPDEIGQFTPPSVSNPKRRRRPVASGKPSAD